MNLLLVVEDGRTRSWMVSLAARLAALGTAVRVETVPAAAPLESSIELLLELERLVKRRLRGVGADRVAPQAIAPAASADFAPAVVIDLAAEPRSRPGVPVLAVRHDGVHGEAEMIAALMSHSTPISEVVDLSSGTVLERSLASLEAAAGLGGALEAVTARVTTVLEARIRSMIDGRPRPEPSPIDPVRRSPRLSVAHRVGSSALYLVARRLYQLCCHAPHWRVGWRLHDGPGIAETGDLSGAPFRILTDPGHRFYADPFPVVWEGRPWVFVEDLDHRVGKGIVSAIPLGEDGPSGPPIVALEEPWHLSYPFLMEHDGALWMIPESSRARDVALYRCVRFPDRWERVSTLVDDASLSDATVFEHAGRWWMFGSLHDGCGGWSDVLAIYSASSLLGPWKPHCANPVLVDRTSARPGGAVFRRGDRLFRPVQDCTDGYGAGLSLAEITRLDDGGYSQVVRHRLGPGPLWPGRRFHTLNRAGRLEVIDGSVPRPKSKLLAGMVEALTVPRSAS